MVTRKDVNGRDLISGGRAVHGGREWTSHQYGKAGVRAGDDAFAVREILMFCVPMHVQACRKPSTECGHRFMKEIDAKRHKDHSTLVSHNSLV
jgi:hypothetical protein